MRQMCQDWGKISQLLAFGALHCARARFERNETIRTKKQASLSEKGNQREADAPASGATSVTVGP